jgi:hypothetical protein
MKQSPMRNSASGAAGELEERLATDQQANNRTAQLLTVTFASEPPWVAALAGGRPGGAKPSGEVHALVGGQIGLACQCLLGWALAND